MTKSVFFPLGFINNCVVHKYTCVIIILDGMGGRVVQGSVPVTS